MHHWMQSRLGGKISQQNTCIRQACMPSMWYIIFCMSVNVLYAFWMTFRPPRNSCCITGCNTDLGERDKSEIHAYVRYTCAVCNKQFLLNSSMACKHCTRPVYLLESHVASFDTIRPGGMVLHMPGMHTQDQALAALCANNCTVCILNGLLIT